MKYRLTLLFLGLVVFSYSQDKIDDYKKMIDSAIIIKKNISNNAWRKKYYLINSDNAKYITNKRQAIFFNDPINIYDKKNRKLLKKGIYVWKIVTELVNNQLIVNIIDFRVFYKNNNYEFINNGSGSTLIFEYSCQYGRWKLLPENKLASEYIYHTHPDSF